ncbi:MAG TPA: DUF4253 domain-containing protein [Anaeromyxobacteraceae bacterium]|nr:DUF4253 domain-containing protein [Anaeromyxobacteraceae bacterium]
MPRLPLRPAAPRALVLTALSALLASLPAAAATPKPISLAAPKSFAAAVAAIEKATGSKAMDLELKGNPLPADEGRAFHVDGKTATRLVDGSHGAFLKAGLYLFRLERSFGMGGGLDTVALVKTTDRDALIRRVGTADPRGKVGTDAIIEWLAALEKDAPFSLNEIGVDFVAGRFAAAPKDPAAVARRCAEFAPELVKGSGSGLDLLTEEIKVNRTLYLIW